MANSKFKSQQSNLENSVMAALLSKAKSSFVIPKKGVALKGKITKLTSAEILVDVNAKTEAVVFEKDKTILRSILSTLKVGDEVMVSVLNPESESGNPVVSLRRFMDNIVWEKLEKEQKNQTQIQGIVKESTKAGLVVDTDIGISAFLPNSQIISVEENIVGKKIGLYVLDLDRVLKKVILSQKKVVTKEQFEKEIKGLKIGQKIDAVVSNITNFGIFVNLHISDRQLDGLIHISEISWEKMDSVNLGEQFKPGQKIEVFVLSFDSELKRINLSIKRLTKDPYEEVINSLKVDQKVKGTIGRIISTGATVVLSGTNPMISNIDAVIKKDKIPPTISFKAGDPVNATIESIDKERHRITLIPVLQAKPIGYR